MIFAPLFLERLREFIKLVLVARDVEARHAEIGTVHEVLALDQEFAAIPARGTEHGARNLVVGDLPHHEARVARVGGGNEYAGNLHRGIGQVVTALAGVHRIEVGGPAGNVPAAVFLLVAHVAEQLEFGRVVGAALLVTAEV